jgi:hypothetical protein
MLSSELCADASAPAPGPTQVSPGAKIVGGGGRLGSPRPGRAPRRAGAASINNTTNHATETPGAAPEPQPASRPFRMSALPGSRARGQPSRLRRHAP